jgi:MFS family permease
MFVLSMQGTMNMLYLGHDCVGFNGLWAVGLLSMQGTMNMLYLGRVVAGVGMGGLSMVAPLYQAETAPAQVSTPITIIEI